MPRVRFIPVLAVALALTANAFAADAHPVVSLWPDGAPGSAARRAEAEHVAANGAVSNIHNPTLTVYLPSRETATGAAVVIAPGGAHRFLTIASEGYNVGQWLAAHGIAGFVLKYRLAHDDSNPAGTPQPYTIEGDALADAQRAIRLIRSRATEWHVNPAAVGILGFSAGGEVAALAAMRPAPGQPGATDPIERENSRPDFQALVYPGQSGKILPAKDSPPAFLACGANDRPDIAEGLPAVYLRFKEAGVPVEIHIFAGVGHGFGYRPERPSGSSSWPECFRDFLAFRKFLSAPTP